MLQLLDHSSSGCALGSIIQVLNGRLYLRQQQGGLFWQQSEPPIALRFGLSTLGEGSLFFPHILLDDWGNEVSGLSLYQWIRDNSLHFPRAEIFGVDQQGQAQQYFLRDLDVVEPLICFGYPHIEAAVSTGIRIERVFVAGLGSGEPMRIAAPTDAPWMLQRARLSWWRVNPESLPRYGFVPTTEGPVL